MGIALKYITIEKRKSIIVWINGQDIFRAKTLFEFFQIVDEKERRCARVIINSAKRAGYLQTLEKGRYILLAKIPIDLSINANGDWKDPKI